MDQMQKVSWVTIGIPSRELACQKYFRHLFRNGRHREYVEIIHAVILSVNDE
jgi:hypothetical protein